MDENTAVPMPIGSRARLSNSLCSLAHAQLGGRISFLRSFREFLSRWSFMWLSFTSLLFRSRWFIS